MKEKLSSWSSMKFFTIALAFILGGVLGWGINQSYYSNNQSNDGFPTVGIGGGPTTDQNINPQLELMLNNLLREHNNLVVLHLQSIYDGKNPLPSAQQLDSNSQNTADYISGVFGGNAGNQFLPVWKDRINQYINYTEALKVNNQNEMNEARQRLNELDFETGLLFENLNDQIDGGEVTNFLNTQNDLILAIIDAYARGDQENMVIQVKTVNNHATQFSNYITQGINQQQNL